MKKADALTAWRGMGENEPILPHMAVIPYKATGSRYGACGIRIDGKVGKQPPDLTAGEFNRREC